MISAKFEGWIARSNSNGGHWYTPGVRTVFVDLIPADAPNDWELGPKMVPGHYGAFLNNPLHPRGHSPYAFTTAKTEEVARAAVEGFFRSSWPLKKDAHGRTAPANWQLVEEPEFAWED